MQRQRIERGSHARRRQRDMGTDSDANQGKQRGGAGHEGQQQISQGTQVTVYVEPESCPLECGDVWRLSPP